MLYLDRLYMPSRTRAIVLFAIACSLLSAAPSVSEASTVALFGVRCAVDASISSDGGTVAYGSSCNGGRPKNVKSGVYVWTSGRTRTLMNGARGTAVNVSGDGRTVIYTVLTRGFAATGRLYAYSVGSRKSRVVARGYMPYAEGSPGISADGRFALVTTVGERRARAGILGLGAKKFFPFPSPPSRYAVLGSAISASGNSAVYINLRFRRPTRYYVFNRSTRKARLITQGEHPRGNVGLQADASHALLPVLRTLSFPGGRTRIGWTIFDLATGLTTGVPVGQNSDPVMTGDGRTIAFSCDDSIFTFDVATGGVSRLPSKLPTAWDNPPDLKISSSGSTVLALYEQKTPRRRVLTAVPTLGAKAEGQDLPAECS